MNATIEATVNPPDISLLLRVHGEQHWLISQVVPVLRQIEARSSATGRGLSAPLAYLELLWLQAGQLAVETDAAAAQLDPADASASPGLCERAGRYLAAVRELRAAVAIRVNGLLLAGANGRGAGASASEPIA